MRLKNLHPLLGLVYDSGISYPAPQNLTICGTMVLRSSLFSYTTVTGIALACIILLCRFSLYKCRTYYEGCKLRMVT